MPDPAAQAPEPPSGVLGARPRLTSRGGGLLAISTLALIRGATLPEPALVQLGLLGLLIVGAAYLWSRHNLRSLSHARTTPESAFAGQIFPLTLEVTHHGRRLDAFSVEIEDSVAGPQERGFHFGWLQAGSSASRQMPTRLPKRGTLHRAQVAFESGFPLGLWKSRIEQQSPLEMMIFPRPVPPKLFEDSDLIALLESNEAESAVVDWEGDFHGLREFQAGDRVKLIHWPTSARSRDLVVRQFDRRLPCRVTLVFHSIRPDQKPQPVDVFESALELLCGTLDQFHRRGIPVDMVASFNQWQAMPVDSPDRLEAVLRTLATATRNPERSFHSLHEVLATTTADDRVIILSEVPLKEWQNDLPELPCMTVCLSVAEIYVQPPHLRMKATAPAILA